MQGNEASSTRRKNRKIKTSSTQGIANAKIKIFMEQLISMMPDILSQSVNDYQLIVSDAPLDDMKMFAACHLAGRSALLHMQELLRLADRLTDREHADAIPLADSDLDDLLRQAKQAIRELDEGEASV